MLPLLLLLLVSPIFGSPVSHEEEDYYLEVVRLSLNTVLALSDDADEKTPSQEAVVTIMLAWIEHLRKTLGEKG